MSVAITVNRLNFTYPDGRPALRGVDLTVRFGEKVALLGPNGAGKSTLLLHINGILRGEGLVEVAGHSLENGGAAAVRAKVGLVFQNPDDQLFSPTVREDVAFGPIYMGLPKNEVERRVAQALRQVGLEGFEERMPHRLSMGERKRAALATVLSMKPEILVLDEPSLGLDPRARRGLIELLRALPQTMIVSTHDMHLAAELFPRSVILDDGVVVADGPTPVMLADRELLEAHGLELP